MNPLRNFYYFHALTWMNPMALEVEPTGSSIPFKKVTVIRDWAHGQVTQNFFKLNITKRNNAMYPATV